MNLSHPSAPAPKIMVVAGEQSGDQLGGGFIAEIRRRYPDAQIAGVGGPLMAQSGCELWAPFERLAVMGLWEVIKHLPDLLRLRRSLLERALAWQPDVFVGIDAPDFNLPLAYQLRKAGFKTIHYVSPSVWAWRQNRIHRIRASVDLMLTLFPFEGQFYQQHKVPFQCVGHPLVDQLAIAPGKQAGRNLLNAPSNSPILAILPGSRAAEVARIAPIFLQAAAQIRSSLSDLVILVAAASTARAIQIQQLLRRLRIEDVQVYVGQTPTVLAASDVVLVASGTATLETALLKKPMVVGYRFSALTYWLGRWLIRVPRFALPNILLEQDVVPELIQHHLTVNRVQHEALNFLNQPQLIQTTEDHLAQIAGYLGRDVDRTVAEAILKMGGYPNV